MRLFKFGKYILFESYRSRKYFISKFDNNVHLVTKLDQIKGHAFNINEDDVDKLLKRGVALFVYIKDGQYLGMVCGHRGPCYIRGPGISLNLDENTVYEFWVYILPGVRGQGVYTALKNAFFYYFSDVVKFTSLVNPNNYIMCRIMHNFGYKEVAFFYFCKFQKISIFIEKRNTSWKIIPHLNFGNRENLLVI